MIQTRMRFVQAQSNSQDAANGSQEPNNDKPQQAQPPLSENDRIAFFNKVGCYGGRFALILVGCRLNSLEA